MFENLPEIIQKSVAEQVAVHKGKHWFTMEGRNRIVTVIDRRQMMEYVYDPFEFPKRVGWYQVDVDDAETGGLVSMELVDDTATVIKIAVGVLNSVEVADE